MTTTCPVPSTRAPLVVVRDLVKRYGTRTVLQGVNLDIHEGAVTAIVGPNGAGKTTLNKMLLGLVHPDAGHIAFDGTDIREQIGYRAHIGYMPQTPHFPESCTAGDVLHLLCDLRADVRETDTFLAEAFGLSTFARQPARALSGGQRQRLNAAAAFLFSPSLLLLDEPTAGLDPVASGILKDHIRRARAAHRAVVITSHVLSELQELADTIVFLHEGRVAWHGPLDILLAVTGAPTLERAVAHLMSQHADSRPLSEAVS